MQEKTCTYVCGSIPVILHNRYADRRDNTVIKKKLLILMTVVLTAIPMCFAYAASGVYNVISRFPELATTDEWLQKTKEQYTYLLDVFTFC